MSRDRILELLMRGLLALLATMPLGLCQRLGSFIGWCGYAVRSRAARTTVENLALCFPNWSASERDHIARRSLVHTASTMMETPSIWLGDLDKLRRSILDVENETLLKEAIDAGRGIVILLPHAGNWEMLNIYLAANGLKTTALYKPPRQNWLKPVMQDIREKFGNELVSTDRRGITRLFRALRQGGIVTVLPDQVPASGEFADFFGEPALTDRLVSRLLQKSGALAICCTIPRSTVGTRGFVVRFTEVDPGIYDDDLSGSVAGVNRSVELGVNACLEQYQWEYKRFKERPPGLPQLYG